jgi:ribosomal protein S17
MSNTYVGRVISRKMQRTGIIQIASKWWYARYKIYITRHKKLFFHDPNEETHIGDEVQVVHSGQKISKNKSFILDKIIHKNVVVSSLQKEVREAQKAQATLREIESGLLEENPFTVKINQKREKDSNANV